MPESNGDTMDAQVASYWIFARTAVTEVNITENARLFDMGDVIYSGA